jgi:mannose-1-phosphate guanylyltransferase
VRPGRRPHHRVRGEAGARHLPGQDAINAGTYVLEPDALHRFPTGRLSFERQVFPGLVAEGAHVEGVVSDAVWADLGTPERYLAGHRLALDGALRWPALDAVADRGDGVRVADDVELAEGAQLLGPVLLAPGVRVGPGACVGPYAVLGAGTVVGAGSSVVDSVLADGVTLGDEVTATRLLAGPGVQVASGTSSARDLVLGDDVRVAADRPLPDGSRVPDPGV